MGRLFLVDLEGRTYNCKSCKTQLALVDDLISKAFDCRRRKAHLFNNVVNITVGPLEERPMISGMHTVAEIFCCCCGQIVGWKYESAHESSQKHKEGKFVLERRRIIDSMDSELYIDTRASTNMKPTNWWSGIQPSKRDELQEQIQSFREQILARLRSFQTLVGSMDSRLGPLESRVAGLEVNVDEICDQMGQHGLIPGPSCARTIARVHLQEQEPEQEDNEDATQADDDTARPSAGSSRRDELRIQIPAFEEQILAQLESLQASIVSFNRWAGSVDSQVAGTADDDTAMPTAGPSEEIPSFEEQVLTQLGSLQTSIVCINNRFRSLDSWITGLELKLDAIRARLPPAPPSNPSQAP